MLNTMGLVQPPHRCPILVANDPNKEVIPERRTPKKFVQRLTYIIEDDGAKNGSQSRPLFGGHQSWSQRDESFKLKSTMKASDDNVEDPFSNFRIGQMLTTKIVSKPRKLENSKKLHNWELSIKPSLLAEPADTGAQVTAEEFNYVIGQSVTGFVNRVDTDWVWLSISRDVRAQLYVLDSASEPSELEEFHKRFHLGQALTGYILSSCKEKKMLRLVLQAFAIFPVRENGDVKVDDTEVISFLRSTEIIPLCLRTMEMDLL